MDRGFELVNNGEYEDALDVGMQLKSMRHTSAFEIIALAHAGLDDLEQAIEILEEGVTQGPTVWLLWQLLGN